VLWVTARKLCLRLNWGSERHIASIKEKTSLEKQNGQPPFINTALCFTVFIILLIRWLRIL
jgi:hypothetical protein